VELVLLLDRDPGKIATLALDLLVSLRLLGLELGELVTGHLPFLAGSNHVFGHLISLCRTRTVPPDPSSDRDATGGAKFHGKEGVSGSSPEEGSAKAPHNETFYFRSTCRFRNVRKGMEPLWS